MEYYTNDTSTSYLNNGGEYRLFINNLLKKEKIINTTDLFSTNDIEDEKSFIHWFIEKIGF